MMFYHLMLCFLLLIINPVETASAVDTYEASLYETSLIGDGLYSFRYGSERTLFVVGENSVAVTDPLGVEAAKVLQQEISAVTALPVSQVVYTNSFFNRIAGGADFKNDGAEFVAHKNCADNLVATPGHNIVPVDRVYSDHYSVDVGAAGFELYFFGQSYGTCLSVVIAKPSNIMLVYGLVNPDQVAIPTDPTLANYYLHNIVPFFEAVEALP